MAERALVRHPLAPVYDAESRLLILGTMPSPASRGTGFYYMHPQNRFWPLMERLFGIRFLISNREAAQDAGAAASAIAERTAFLHERHLALWDVLASCRIAGAGDGSIRDPVANDLAPLLECGGIRSIACTGKTAASLYRRLCSAKTGIAAVELPSTSPANQGRWPLEKLLPVYAAAVQSCVR